MRLLAPLAGLISPQFMRRRKISIWRKPPAAACAAPDPSLPGAPLWRTQPRPGAPAPAASSLGSRLPRQQQLLMPLPQQLPQQPPKRGKSMGACPTRRTSAASTREWSSGT
jgi:hypothetical protein